MKEKATLREEFRLWWQAAPRIWVIVGTIALGAIVFRGTLEIVATTAFLFLFLFVLVSIIPAIVGALAGKFVGRIIRRIRYADDFKRTSRVPLVLPHLPR